MTEEKQNLTSVMVDKFLTGRLDSWRHTFIHPEINNEVSMICWQKREHSKAGWAYTAHAAPAYLLRLPLPYCERLRAEFIRLGGKRVKTVEVKWDPKQLFFVIEWLENRGVN